MTSGSSVGLAMGVMSSMRTSDAFVLTAPSITSHDHEGRRIPLVRESGEAHRAARAGMFSTGADPTRSSS